MNWLMNLSDLSIKAYSVDIIIELSNLFNSIKQIRENGGEVRITLLSPDKYEFQINHSNIGTLKDVIQKLNSKYYFITELVQKVDSISFVFSEGDRPDTYQGQRPIIKEFVEQFLI